MTEPAHYPRGPSGAHRWLICTDSPEAEQGYPDETTDAADEGTAAHWLLEQCLLAGQDVEQWLEAGHASSHGRVVPAGEEAGTLKEWPITGEMVEAVQLHIDEVNKHAKKRGTKLFVERRVTVGEQYGLDDVVGGTADTIMYLPKSKTLLVYDFKYGKGHVVEADSSPGNVFEYDEATGKWKEATGPDMGINPQIGLYAIAALSQLEKLIGKKVDVKWIELAVIQPRAYHKKGPVRRKKITPLQMMSLEARLIEAVNGPKVRVPGDHCHFCRAKPDCKPYHESRGGLATGGFEAEVPAVEANPHHHPIVQTEPEVPSLIEAGGLITRPVKGLTLAELAKARGVLATLKAWAKEVEEEVRTRLLHDLQVPNARLAQGPGKRAFGGTKATIDIAALETAQEVGVPAAELYEPAVIKSPAQLEKLLGKAKFKATPLHKLVAYEAGGPIVVDADSDKPEYLKDNGFTAEAPVESPLL